MASEMSESTAKVPEQSKIRALLAWRFGVRHLLLAMAAASVVCAVLFVAPGWLAAASVLAIANLAMVVIAAGAIYGAGNCRTFCLGALFPMGLVFVATAVYLIVISFECFVDPGNPFRELDTLAGGLKFLLVVGLVLTPVAGGLAMLVRGYVEGASA